VDVFFETRCSVAPCWVLVERLLYSSCPSWRRPSYLTLTRFSAINRCDRPRRTWRTAPDETTSQLQRVGLSLPTHWPNNVNVTIIMPRRCLSTDWFSSQQTRVVLTLKYLHTRRYCLQHLRDCWVSLLLVLSRASHLQIVMYYVFHFAARRLCGCSSIYKHEHTRTDRFCQYD